MMTTLPKLKILLVEDERIARLVHCYLLKEMGYTPDIAKNGRSALKLSARGYDLIFMDIGLPDIDGLQVTAQIRAWEKKENRNPSRIIALTAYNIDEVKDKCLAAGIDEVAEKPVKPEALQQFILQCGKG